MHILTKTCEFLCFQTDMNEVWGMTLHLKVLISDISTECCGLIFEGQNVQKTF